MNEGQQLAHNLHEEYACNCYSSNRKNNEIKNPIYHKIKCRKILDFFHELNDLQRVQEIEDIINKNQQGNVIYGCCCQNEELPHDESAKFKLLCKSQTSDYTFMFDKGETVIKQNFDMYDSQLRSQNKLFGRNKEMYIIFNSLIDCNPNNQFVVVYGDSGSGLTEISKKVARHLKERELVNDIFILDFEDPDKSILKFKNNLKRFKNGKYKYQSQYTLIILDNCDDLIQNNLNDFIKILSDIKLQVKFIITTHFKPKLKFGEYVITYVQLKPLDVQTAISIIQHYTNSFGNQYRTLINDQQRDLNQLLERKQLLPKFIMKIIQCIKMDSKLSDLDQSQDPYEIIFKQDYFILFDLYQTLRLASIKFCFN